MVNEGWGDNGFFNIVNLYSLYIGLQNLFENRKQSEHNDVHRENDRQAKYLLSEIARLFEEQNKMLLQQDEMLAKILKATAHISLGRDDLKKRIWKIIQAEDIAVTNQNLDWLIDRAYKEKSDG